jgi:hypothetical protein
VVLLKDMKDKIRKLERILKFVPSKKAQQSMSLHLFQYGEDDTRTQILEWCNDFRRVYPFAGYVINKYEPMEFNIREIRYVEAQLIKKYRKITFNDINDG